MAEEDGARDEAHWFSKAAKQARKMAEELDDGAAANTLLQVAQMYEAMAWRAAERESGSDRRA
jgi:hypothetical protein